MRSYMQNIDAKDEQAPISRVSRHECSKGDGVFDKHTVFADHLLLPRMVLPLDRGRVLIGQTNTNDIELFRDSEGRRRLRRQDRSSTKAARGRGTWSTSPAACSGRSITGSTRPTTPTACGGRPTGTAIKEPTESNGGQWGVAQDDNGKLWWSNAGGEKGLWHFQTHVLYGAMDVPEQFDPTFMEVWPAMPTPDVQGGHRPLPPEEKTLNHFTACGGQEIFRGDRLPEDLRGDALLAEPVGRLIRRAKVDRGRRHHPSDKPVREPTSPNSSARPIPTSARST